MAKLLESHIRSDTNFEVPAVRHLGLVVFWLKVRSMKLNLFMQKRGKDNIQYVHWLIIVEMYKLVRHTLFKGLRVQSFIFVLIMTLLSSQQQGVSTCGHLVFIISSLFA